MLRCRGFVHDDFAKQGNMATYVLQVLGTVGIIETIVEFSYAIVKLEDFTPFEKTFFLVSGTFEMAGELFVLWRMVKTMLSKDNAPEACDVAKSYVKDPIHIYAFSPWQGEDGYDDDLEEGAGYGIILALLPTLFWWLILIVMIFAAGFASQGDETIMLALAIVSFFSCLYTLGIVGAMRLFKLAVPTYLTAGYAMLPWLYSVQKVFEVYLLISRGDRLAADELGVSLILFQLVELTSCAVIVGKYALVQFFKRKEARTAQQSVDTEQEVSQETKAGADAVIA